MKSIVLIVLFVVSLHATAQTQKISAINSSNSNQSVFAINGNNEFLSREDQNSNYLKSATKSTPSIVRLLENIAANFDITTIEAYDETEPSEYHVTFKNRHSHLYVTYNQNGEIIKSKERYVNIAIQSILRVKIAKIYPYWSIEDNTCTKVYSLQNGAHISYQIKIKKGNDTKIIYIVDDKILM